MFTSLGCSTDFLAQCNIGSTWGDLPSAITSYGYVVDGYCACDEGDGTSRTCPCVLSAWSTSKMFISYRPYNTVGSYVRCVYD